MSSLNTERRGVDLLRDARLNHGSAFTLEERKQYGLEGLLPDVVVTSDVQVHRVELHLDSLATDLHRYVYFSDLQERNESLFYRALQSNPARYMPIVYTPTVGTACQQFGRLYRRPKGMWLSYGYKGRLADVLRNWPEEDVRFIVVTDGERILGLGDLGANGMGIPIGKLALYTACAGAPPHHCLPITLDVGTNNEELLQDPFYIGRPHPRIAGAEYDAFIEEFVSAVEEVFPKAFIQWEDFANHHAVPLLERYRHRITSFNDDIQGTAAIGVAGIMAALRFKQERLEDQRFLFFGAGSAGVGIASLLCTAMVTDGLTLDEARSRCWLVDSKGLVQSARTDLTDTKVPFAHDHAPLATLEEAVRELKPTALIGTSTIPHSFTRAVIEQMAQNAERPIIFPFSNPTSKSECTAEEAYTWTKGKAIFASGSPFPPVTLNNRTLTPGQGNNVYIFPAMGLAVFATNPREIPDRAFSVAARTLAAMVTQEEFEKGLVYPPIANIRASSMHVAVAVATYFFDSGLARVERPANIDAYVRSLAWEPEY